MNEMDVMSVRVRLDSLVEVYVSHGVFTCICAEIGKPMDFPWRGIVFPTRGLEAQKVQRGVPMGFST